MDHTQAVQDAGVRIAGQHLQGINSATTVSVLDGKHIVTDGPFGVTADPTALEFADDRDRRVILRRLDEFVGSRALLVLGSEKERARRRGSARVHGGLSLRI